MNNNQDKFPVEKVTHVLSNPENFRLLEKIPDTLESLQHVFNLSPVGDEYEIVVLDLETSGLDVEDSEIIEIGLLSASYSPSTNTITSINRVDNFYEQPSEPISETITKVTGITNEMLEGKRIDNQTILKWFANDPLVIAHNAKFDRGFFDKRFNVPELQNLRWACSIKDVDWYSLDFGSQKLEYLLMSQGYFYNAHRALIDCMATIFLLHLQPEALKILTYNANALTYTLHALGAPFAAKDMLKGNDYEWNPDSPLGKHWSKTVTGNNLEEELAELDNCYMGEFNRSKVNEMNARVRYKK